MKLAPFNQDWKNDVKEFTNETIELLTGIDCYKWCEFSGLIDNQNSEWMIDEKLFKFSGLYPVLSMTALNDVVQVSFTFNLEDLSVYINLFILKRTSERVGTKAFSKHLKLAKNVGFRILNCRASDNYGKKDHNGYITWGKFGFTMKEESHEIFLNTMKTLNRNEKCLQLLIKTEEGCEFWKARGFTWNATFSLSENSLNRRIWSIYLKIRRLENE